MKKIQNLETHYEPKNCSKKISLKKMHNLGWLNKYAVLFLGIT